MISCCDLIEHPRALQISPGSVHLARQIAAFPEFRQAMLRSVGSMKFAAALGSWRANGTNDLGLMLLEMWAYLADSLAFYDETFAHECYLRTARNDASVRGLVARLGYKPKPAIAASVELALLVDGRRPVEIPAGVAFRSSASAEPSQVFEVERPTWVHPLRNRWQLVAPTPLTAAAAGGPGASANSVWLDAKRSSTWAVGDVTLVQPKPTVESTFTAARIVASEPSTSVPNARVDVVEFSKTIVFGASTPLSEVRLLKATRSVTLWTRTSGVSVSSVGSPAVSRLHLNGVYRDIEAGALVLVQCTASGVQGVAWFRVQDVVEDSYSVLVASGAESHYAHIPVTRITLDASLTNVSRGGNAAWSNTYRSQLRVHYALRDAGRLALPSANTVAVGDALELASAPLPVDDTKSTHAIISDVNGVAHQLFGEVDFATRLFAPTSFDPPRGPLTLPVQMYGNIVRASRGETVVREVLGSGDATAPSQSFRLQKGPLTFVAAAGAAEGFASTLQVWVDGKRWFETPNFLGSGPEDEVFVVELDAAGKATLTFGDGVYGKRLSTGSDNIVAAYRFGAGGSAPAAGAITQIAKGTQGLRSVVQPLAAFGGSDAEATTNVRATAPLRTLTLGRAVSIRDMEAFAAECAGVRAVSVAWAWSSKAQRPVVQVWVVGDGAASAVRTRLAAVTDPTTPVVVDSAVAVPATLSLDVQTDPNFIPGEVSAGVGVAVLGKGGALDVESLGVGTPVYFSRLLHSVHAVAGVTSVKKVWSHGGFVANGYGVTPGQGAYFTFPSGIVINGEVYNA